MSSDVLSSKLQDGERFPYDELTSNLEGLNKFWEWWIENGELDSFNIPIPPRTIIDIDDLLVPTIGKSQFKIPANELCWAAMLREFVETMKIAIDTVVEREGLRTSAHDFFSERSETSTKVPQLVLTGGGYGAGKTSVVESFLKEGAVNLTERSMMGADLCRDLIPEYSQIISVLDSRGGEVCQEESYLLLNRLLDRLLETKRSFIWDSTLQYTDRANEIIRKARDHEFEIYLLAVTVDPFRALERAFERAVKIRRFLKSEALIKSHRRFAKNLPILISQVDFAYVHDSTIEDETPRMIAKKEGFEAELEVIDPEAYNLALERGSDE